MPPTSPGAGFRPAALTRRGFLKRTAATSAFLLAVRLGAAPSPARAAVHPRAKHLDVDSHATLEALCDQLITPAPGAPTASGARTALRIDHEVGLQGPLFARDIRDALTVVAYSGILEGKLGAFTKLGPEAQEAVLRGMMGSRFSWRRTSFQGLKQIILFYYYADDRTWPSTGYNGPWEPRKIAETESDFPFPPAERKA
ncbi:MAG: hypothetical protein Q8R92_01830 [Deltaproteobacteria bacterium]|nr:hypothetical protein [Deltaproteobacteria bacterium]